MKPLRIFRHVVCAHPGYLGQFLEDRGIPHEVVCVDEQRPVPQQLDDVSGLIFMGGAMSVNDPCGWIDDELDLIRHAIRERVPVLGICFGGQLLARALGAEVMRGESMEIGWHPIEMVEDARDSAWLSGLDDTLHTFHWHADTFAIPSGATPLLRSRCFRNQAFAYGPHLAMQFHLEMTETMVDEWVSRYGGDLQADHPCVQNAESIREDLTRRIVRLNGIADRIYGRWLEMAGLA